MASAENTSVHCVNAVIYKASRSDANNWEPLGDGEWTDMHILKNDLEGEPGFRVVAWQRENKTVILNASIEVETIWNTATGHDDTFAEFATTMEDDHYGLYFPDRAQRDETTRKVEECMAQMSAFQASKPSSLAVLGEHNEVLLGSGGGGDVPSNRSSKKKSTRRISLAEYHEQKSLPKARTSRACNEGSASAAAASKEAEDQAVIAGTFRHLTNVTYDEDRAAWNGLPEGWESKKEFEQFGVELRGLPLSTVEGYENKIPSVLVMMRRYLSRTREAIDQVGIFRLAPDKEECSTVKELINHGKFDSCNDVNIVATLIKVWFREFPRGLYNSIPDAKIAKISDMNVDQIAAEYEQFEEPNKSLILWLLDMMAEYVLNEAVNKMSARNMAIVMSPNLYMIDDMANPMAAMTKMQKISEFTTKVLAARLLEKHGYDAHIT